MPKIEFLQERVLRDEHEGTANETVFKKGQRMSVSEETARHWTDRGLAVVIEEDKPAAKKRGRPAKQDESEGDQTEE